MNTSGEAADQVVRMTLDGVEVLLRISGTGASKLAGFLYAALKDHKKTRGRTRLEAMLKSGKPLEVFSIRKDELRIFTREAKRYGILYCGSTAELISVRLFRNCSSPYWKINLKLQTNTTLLLTGYLRVQTPLWRGRARLLRPSLLQKTAGSCSMETKNLNLLRFARN